MTDGKYVFPSTWKKLLKDHKYPLTPRMIWQSDPDKQVDITNWKFYWTKDGKTILQTFDEFI